MIMTLLDKYMTWCYDNRNVVLGVVYEVQRMW